MVIDGAQAAAPVPDDAEEAGFADYCVRHLIA